MAKINKEERMVLKNGLYIYVLNIFSSIIPILTIPYVTRVLGTEGYGKFSIAFNWITYAQVLVEYGFAMYGTRKIAVSKTKDSISLCFSEIFFARLFLCLFSFGVMTIYIVTAVEKHEIAVCMYILFLMVFGCMFQQNWLLQGLEKMQYIVLIGVVSRLISLVLIFVFIKKQEDLYLYCFFYAMTFFIIGVCGFFFVLRVLKIRLLPIKFKQIFIQIKEAVYMFISVLSGKVMTSIGVTILGMMESQSDVGIYSAISKVPTLITMMFSPISQAIYPYISKKFSISFEVGLKYIKRITIYTILCFTLIVVFFIIFSEKIIYIAFGADYVSKHKLLKVLMCWVDFGIFNNFIGIQTLVASGNSKQYGRAFSISALLSIIGNIFLIRFFGMFGAAYALLFAEIALTVVMLIYVIKIGKKNHCWRKN